MSYRSIENSNKMLFSPTKKTLWILFFLCFNHVFLVQGNDICRRTFRQSGNTFNITCPERCITLPFKHYNVVWGTSVYHPNSLICLSALHAGVARIGAATPLTFNKTETKQKFDGSNFNRVLSGNKETPDVGFYFKNERFIQTDRAGTDELVMVTNNKQLSENTDAYAACLPNSLETLRNSSAKPEITDWLFRKLSPDEKFEDSVYNIIIGIRRASSRGHYSINCIGSNFKMDISAIIGKINDNYEFIFPTVTASLGETVTLPYSFNSGRERGNRKIHSVSLSDQQYHPRGNSNSRLIVRACKKDRSGANCSGWCRDCLNNGECDSDTGECVCSSGTRGKNCQNFCPVNKFGAKCHLDCDRIHSLWKKSTGGTCSGLTFCLRDPKGCSCQPGFKPPRCNTECDAGSYGIDCLNKCDYCNGGTCDGYGRCDQGCKNENLCNEAKAPLNLPRFRKPPLITDCDVRGCAVTFSEWDSDYDDGELSDTDGELRYGISIENQDNPSANAYIPTYPGERREFSYDFVRGISYNITLNILTNRGKATEEYNMRIQSHNLTLPCLETYSSVDYNVTNIGQTSVTVEWVHRNGPHCPKVRYPLLVKDGANTILNTSSDLAVYAIAHLTPDTLYQITLEGKTKMVTTHLYPGPPAPDYIRINVTSDKTRIVWNEVKFSRSYEVTLKLVKYIGCPHNSSDDSTYYITATHMILDYNNHISYSAMFEVCVAGVNRVGKSLIPVCQTFSTPPNDVPDLEWQELSCSTRSQYQSLDCTTGIESECQKFHGPNITSVWKIKKLSNCTNDTSYEDIIVDNFTYSTTLNKNFRNLEHYTDYSITVYLKNSIGQSISTQGAFSTLEANRSGVVQDFKVSGATNNSLFLEWLIPCPSLALIQSYKLSHKNKNKWRTEIVKPTSLCSSSNGAICYQLEDLHFNVNYSLKVQSCKTEDAYECSDDSRTVYGLTTPTAPGKPTLMPTSALYEIVVVVTTSQYVGEQPSCWASLHKDFLQQNSSKDPVIPQKGYTFTFTGLRPSSKYLVKSGCCNSKACSSVAETATNTKLTEPMLNDTFYADSITNTTIVIKIPIISSGDSIINVVIVVVSGYGEERMNLTALYAKYKRAGMEIKRSGEEELGTKLYVAGVVENKREFTVGSGYPPNNPPLDRGQVYSVIPLIELELNNDRLLVEEPKITFTAGGSLHQPNQYLWIVIPTGSLVVMALLIIGIVVHRNKREVTRRPEENIELESTLYGNPQEDIGKRNIQPESTLYELPLEEIRDEAVPPMNLEGLLNFQINSDAAVEKFMAIPRSIPKSTSDSESNENRKKNRNQNRIYNDTRVRLRVMDGDPSSDYINANHITSVSKNRRYIASQGPKDCNVSTIADFWRMVIEQEVNVIIMVANFIEKGIAKVGEYVRHEFPLEMQSLEGMVTVVKREITSFCTISTVQVRILATEGYIQHEVTHYHFSQWPDHGAPSELRTLSQMILHIALKHNNIHAVVHGSEGIGRTGTILFCFICYDYLLNNMPLDIFKVIRQLRSDRGRMIENQMQFKLCLNLLDEVLFGRIDSFPVSELNEGMPTNQNEYCKDYQRLARLPNSLTCSTASLPDNCILNRNCKYLPPDLHRVYIQGSEREMLYINAVKFQGLEIGVEYIATQHPFKNGQDEFWNLVHSNKTSKIVVLHNEFDEEFPEFYPTVVGSSFEIDNNVIKCTSRNSLSRDLIESEIALDTRKKEAQRIKVYEVQNWKRGALHPQDLTESVRVADILLSERDNTPPVLVCGDGVTACGLMVGIINTIDRLSVHQDINIYRTAVMLRRCHPSVIVDQIQLVRMLEAAKIYTENYSLYGNPNDFRV